MAEVKNITMGNGEIVFISEVEEIAPTSETNGNITINDAGRPGIPAHFKATFWLSVEMEENGIEFTNDFVWKDIVLSDKDTSAYREIEAKAARNLAPALRAAADRIERAVEEYESRQSAEND